MFSKYTKQFFMFIFYLYKQGKLQSFGYYFLGSVVPVSTSSLGKLIASH